MEPEIPTEFEVSSNTPSEETLLPQLRHLDQTPITPSERKVAKRDFDALSPVQKSDLSDDIWKKMDGTIMSSIKNTIPMIIENIMVELQCTFKSFIDPAIDTAIDTAKEEIYSKVEEDIQYVDMKTEFTAKCEAEIMR